MHIRIYIYIYIYVDTCIRINHNNNNNNALYDIISYSITLLPGAFAAAVIYFSLNIIICSCYRIV